MVALASMAVVANGGLGERGGDCEWWPWRAWRWLRVVVLVTWRWLRVVALAWLAVVVSGGFGDVAVVASGGLGVAGGGCE